MSGIVFNIQSYSLHDGPGIRTIIFLKGCPLQCIWCANPESQESAPQVYFNSGKCIYSKGCSLCTEVCSQGAVGGGTLDFERCINCGKCSEICPSKAISIYGREMTAAEAVDIAERDSAFFRHGGGGLTLSGGEPFMQAEFALEILREAKHRRIDTSAETCGCCNTEVLRQAAGMLNSIIYDIKILDEEKHIRYTGGSNKMILENLEMLFSEFPRLHKHIRTPVIPTVTDSEEDISAIRDFLRGRDNYTYELLPYHRFGEKKYEFLGRKIPALPERLDENTFERLKSL
ncbi:MAG: glycyl-radical enzyme activating protein [Oscillospiraceae bacterium]